MITHPTPTGWQVIYQRAHALLAAQIVAHWDPPQRPSYAAAHWQATLAAITQHDDAGREWEGEGLLTPAGAPKDFRISTVSARQPSLSIEHARYQGQYSALLQAMHVQTLYADFAAEHAELGELLEAIDGWLTGWRKALKLSKAEAEACYRLLKWGDDCSLILCQRHLPTDGRAIEIGAGPDGTIYTARMLTDSGGADPRTGDAMTGVMVEPWPFAVPAFTVSIETTRIDGLAFASDADLVTALQSGTIAPQVWTFARSEKALSIK